jgi:alkyldihydroxyacetonephosphate synthase
MSDIARALTDALGPDRVSTDDAVIAAHRKDYWILAHLREREGRLGPPPACVVTARETADVATTLRTAQQHGVPVVPYGGASGVLGGAVPPGGTIVLDLSAMNRHLELNETALYSVAQAGLLGGEYEKLLQARGYTTGHYPQSIDRASVGGLVATRSAGQFSTKYGNIEDLVLGLEVVLASGDVVRLGPIVPRAAAGPSLREIFLGSEGALGVITEVTQRVYPLPEKRVTDCFPFPSMAAGLDAIRRILRFGWHPAVLRLYDGIEAGRNFASAGVTDGSCVLLVVSEGPAALVAAEMQAVAEIAGTKGLGAAPGEHWLGHRNTVPSWDFFLDKEIVVDTIEIAATWDKLPALYDGVIASLNTVPGMIAASAHTSHGYPEGTNLYITFALKPDDWARAEDIYLDAWSRVMQTTLAGGGTIAHHHGIGRLRVPWLQKELGTAYPVLRALKRALDPAGILNPGTLLGAGS